MATPFPASVEEDSARGLCSIEHALARMGARNVSLVVLRVEDLQEIRALYGKADYQAATRSIQHALGRLARGRGFGARSAATEYTLALPGMYPREARALLCAHLGRPERFAIDADGEDVDLMPEIAADLVRAGETIRDCHARLRADALGAIAQERARLAGMARMRDQLVKSGARGLADARAVYADRLASA